MKSIEVKKFTVHTFTSNGINIFSAVLTLRKPIKLSEKSDKAKEQLIKKLPTIKTHLFKYHNFIIEYNHPIQDGVYRFLFNKFEG